MKTRKIKLGITDCIKFHDYKIWFEEIDKVDIIKLTEKENNLQEFNTCDALVLSGGEDVHPKLYNKPEYLSIVKERDINYKRDLFEFKLLEQSLKEKKPILGICRGIQVANVFFGGTLIPDIPTFGKPNHSKFPDKDRKHIIDITPNSLLTEITKKTKGEVNSSHHQAPDVVASDLKISALSSSDDIIEALEWKDPKDKPFLLLLQWHPERMEDSPFSTTIKKRFIEEAFNSSKKQ